MILLRQKILHDPMYAMPPLFLRFWYMRSCRIPIISRRAVSGLAGV